MLQNCCKGSKNIPFEQVLVVKSAEMCPFCLRLSRFEVDSGRWDRGRLVPIRVFSSILLIPDSIVRA